MHHVFQVLSKLKIFVPVLPQVTLALNSNACWIVNYAEQDKMSAKSWCRLLKFEDELEQGWELMDI